MWHFLVQRVAICCTVLLLVDARRWRAGRYLGSGMVGQLPMTGREDFLLIIGSVERVGRLCSC